MAPTMHENSSSSNYQNLILVPSPITRGQPVLFSGFIRKGESCSQGGELFLQVIPNEHGRGTTVPSLFQ